MRGTFIRYCLLPVLGGVAGMPVFAADTRPQPLSSLTHGYYYSSTVVAEGAVQLSACRQVSRTALKKWPAFQCLQEKKGYRCVADNSLDVVLVFSDKAECERDRSALLNEAE